MYPRTKLSALSRVDCLTLYVSKMVTRNLARICLISVKQSQLSSDQSAMFS